MAKLIEGVDLTLEDLGRQLREAHMLQREANRKIRELEAEQRKRINQIMQMRHLEFTVYEDGRNVLKSELYPPSEHQRQVLAMFEKAMGMDDPDMLKVIYDTAIEFNCQFTTWTTEFGENLDTAYAVRASELKASQLSAA